MMNMLINLDREKIEKDGKYTVEEVWQMVNEITGKYDFKQEKQENGAILYVGQGEQSSFDGCGCSYVILSESEWFARYVSEWIWYETFPFDKTKWGGSDLLVKESKRNPLFQSVQQSK